MNKDYTKINGVFSNKDDEWTMNFEKLKDLTSEEFAKEILEDFENQKDTTMFSAAIHRFKSIEEERKYPKQELIYVSIGHFIYSHHFTYFIESGRYHRTTINQKFYENIVKPFQDKRNWKTGDGFLSHTKRKLKK